jgi:hypothetical protein
MVTIAPPGGIAVEPGGDLMLQREEDSSSGGAQRSVELLDAQIGQRPGLMALAGIVERDVEPAVGGDRVPHEILDARRVGDVSDDRVRLAAGVCDLPCDLGQLGLAAGRQHNAGARCGQRAGGRGADPSAGPGDDPDCALRHLSACVS